MNARVFDALRGQGYVPRTMLDVGAHVGTFTQQFLGVFPDCVPTLIEPNPFCAEALAKLGVETHGVAASDTAGRAELFLTKEWLQSTGSSLYRENTHFFRDDVVVKRTVDKVRLDDLFKGRTFDFVKIDTQGSELDVLRGGERVLRAADFVLLEVSMVEYNIGGARAEALFAELDRLGFHPVEVVDFHRLSGVQNGALLQMDFLFERRSRRATAPIADVARLRAIAGTLGEQGRYKDALTLLEHVDALQGAQAETLRQIVRMLGADGQTLKAIEKLALLKAVEPNTDILVEDIRTQMPAAFDQFNALVAAGRIDEAEKYAAALAALAPGNVAFLNSALSCNVALGRKNEAARYATAVLKLEPAHEAARAVMAEAQPANDVHPLLRLRNIYDAASATLCGALDAPQLAAVDVQLAAARELVVDVPAGGEWAGWAKHYRLAVQALDLPMVAAETPAATKETPAAFVTAAGVALDWDGVQARAKRLKARAVFFAAADRAYVDLYAGWYVKSILKYCDVNALIVVHVIGGAASLKSIAKSVGINDERLIFAGDTFDAGAVTTKCYDAPPKGLIAKPVAHFQSVRFLRLGALLNKLKLPVFVSDIDLILQRGVADLLDRCAGDDVVLNENAGNTNAGSRLTANLLLVNPTRNAATFLRFLKGYLEKALSGAEVSRWIDQFGLLMARHHLALKAKARIGYFDTSSDINNVMYASYQAHPFRFLSLYHGFDTSSLEAHSGVSSAKKKAAGRR